MHAAFDSRIFHKEAVSLVQAGYCVTYICHHPKEEFKKGIKIVPLPTCKNRFSRMTISILRILYLALRDNADIYHFHDPELICVGIFLKFLNKKVIYDIHELVYYQIEYKDWIKSNFLKKIAQNVYLLLESMSVKFLDYIILAEDGYREYFERRYRGFSRYGIIRNFPIINLSSGRSEGG